MSASVRNGLQVMLSSLLLLGSVETTCAADRFVATTGSDAANDCSASTAPCRSVAYAIGQAASGDEVKVGHGVYVEDITVSAPAALTVTGGWSNDYGTRDLVKHATILSHGSFVVTPSGDDSVEVHLDGLRFQKNFTDAEAFGNGTTQLTVNDCAFSGVGGFGGGQEDGTGTSILHVTHSTFKGVRGGPGTCLNCVGGIVSGAGAGTTQLTVEGSTFIHDQGGVNFQTFLSGTGSVSITDTTFDHCSAKNIGAIFLLAGGPGGTSFTMTNSFITRSAPYAIGVDVYESAPPATVTLGNDTIFHNKGPVFVAPLVQSANANVDLTNVIVWGPHDGLAVDPGIGANLDHDDIGAITGSTNDLGGNVAVDPQLVGSSVHLASTSPLIDAGTCTGAPPTDIDGDPRPTGAGCDIGADEFAPWTAR